MKNGSKRGQSSNFRDSAPNKRPSVAPFEAPNDSEVTALIDYCSPRLPCLTAFELKHKSDDPQQKQKKEIDSK